MKLDLTTDPRDRSARCITTGPRSSRVDGWAGGVVTVRAALALLWLVPAAHGQDSGVPVFSTFEKATRWVEGNADGVPDDAGSIDAFEPSIESECGGQWVTALTHQPGGMVANNSSGVGSFSRATVDVPAPALREFVTVLNQGSSTTAETSASGYLSLTATYAGPKHCVGKVQGAYVLQARQVTEVGASHVRSVQVVDVRMLMQTVCGGGQPVTVNTVLHAEDNRTSSSSPESVTIRVFGVPTTLSLNPDSGQISGMQLGDRLQASPGPATWFYAKAHLRGTAFGYGNGNLFVPAQLNARSRAVVFSEVKLTDSKGGC